MNIGLFGGSFDPPHVAHVALAHTALNALALDELRWVPTGDPWHKVRTVAPAVHREAMVRLAIAGEPRFVLERCELERSGPSYTIDTVEELQRRTPGAHWFLIVGEDQYDALHHWVRWRELLDRVDLAVARRPGGTSSADAEVAQRPHRDLPLPEMNVSATDIRRRVAAGRDITRLVPAGVAGYIDRNGLYRASPRS